MTEIKAECGCTFTVEYFLTSILGKDEHIERTVRDSTICHTHHLKAIDELTKSTLDSQKETIRRLEELTKIV